MSTTKLPSSTQILIKEHYENIRNNQDKIPQYNSQNAQDQDALYFACKRIIEAMDCIYCLTQ